MLNFMALDWAPRLNKKKDTMEFGEPILQSLGPMFEPFTNNLGPINKPKMLKVSSNFFGP